jgi:competence protein ComEC
VFSLYRAFGMAVLLVSAKVIHRPMQPMRALGTAAFLLLLWSPHILFSVGFQLSFTATFAVLLCVTSIPMWKTRRWPARLLNYAIGTIYVGVFVQVFIAPLLIHHFNRLSVVSPLATLFFFPFVFAVFFLSILCAGLGSLCPLLGDCIAFILSPVNETFAFLLLYAKSISPSLVHVPPADPLIYCAGITLIWRSKCMKWRIAVGTILFCASFLRPLL